MRSTFWPNRIFERQSSQNRKTGLKFSSRRENSALSMKILQNAFFRSCAARFGQIAFLSVKVLKIVRLALNSLTKNCTKRSFQVMRSTFWQMNFWKVQNRKTPQILRSVRFPWKLYKTLLGKSNFWAWKFSKSAHWPEILAKRGKQSAFLWKLYKSHLWAQNFQNRHPGLKFSPKRENSALFMIEQNDLFRSCAAHFREIDVKVLKIVTLAWNSRQKGKTVRFYENCTKRSFQVMRSTFWPNRIFERESSQNRQTGLKFSPNRENSALLITIVQNALFRSCAARFGQIALLSGKVLKIVKLGFPWKLYKTLFLGHAVHVLAELHLWAWKFSKSSHWPEILAETGKQCALDENCTKGSFQVMRSTFWPNRIFERQSSQNRQTGLKFSPNRENSALLITIVQNALFRSCAARFGQIAFLTVKVLKIAKLG